MFLKSRNRLCKFSVQRSEGSEVQEIAKGRQRYHESHSGSSACEKKSSIWKMPKPQWPLLRTVWEDKLAPPSRLQRFKGSEKFLFFSLRFWDRERVGVTKHEGAVGQEKQTPCRARSPKWDSIPGLRDCDLNWGQQLNGLEPPTHPWRRQSSVRKAKLEFCQEANRWPGLYGYGVLEDSVKRQG